MSANRQISAIDFHTQSIAPPSIFFPSPRALATVIAFPNENNSLSVKLPETPRCDMTELSLTLRLMDALLPDRSWRCWVREDGREVGLCLLLAAAADSADR